MVHSSVCPCATCFNTPKTTPPQTAIQRQMQRDFEKQREKQTKAHAYSQHFGHDGLLGKLRRSRSIESTASDLVGLRGAAQPIGITEQGK